MALPGRTKKTMVLFLKRLSVFALTTVILVLTFSFVAGPSSPSNAYAKNTSSSNDIECLKQQAANDRAFAEKRRQAEQWRKDELGRGEIPNLLAGGRRDDTRGLGEDYDHFQ